jgi:two-component system cell cycle sensor histidine kinase/response regulator CckA
MDDEQVMRAALREIDGGALLEALIVGSSQGVALFDGAGALIAANRAHAGLFGPQAPGSYNVLHDPRLAALRPLIVRALAGEAVTMPRQVVSEAGAEPRASESRWVALRGADGAVRGAAMLSRDVSAELQLRQRTAELRRFTESGMLGVMHWESGGTITSANDTFLAMLGYRREDFVAGSLRWDQITSPEYGPLDAAGLAEIASSGACRPFEKAYWRKDGALLPVIVAGATFEGEPQRGVAFVIDISERKRIERELAEREEKFRALIAYSSDALCLIDEEAVVTFASESVTRLLGWLPAELVGRPSLIELVHPEDLDLAHEEMARSLASAGEPVRSELRLRHRDGSYRLVGVVTRNLFGDPAVRSTVANIVDVTENRALQQQFLQAQKMEAIGRLAGGIAHDFNNMLSAILGFAGIVRSELPPGDPLTADVAEVMTAAERASALTKQLLAFSRKQILAPRPLDLGAQLGDLEKMLRRLIGEDIEMVIVRGPELGHVRADPAQIEQIVLNLVINARDAVGSGGRITLETANVEIDEDYARQHPDIAAGPHVMLAVSDDGVGMERHVRERAFEPFFTTKAIGEGTGLGLATVLAIVKQSSGHIHLESHPGRGTSFRLYFPRSLEASAPMLDRVLRIVPARGAETILLVEDEVSVRAFASRALQRAGYVVLAADNGGDALLLGEQHPGVIDLLLTDVVLPRLSGRALAARLQVIRPALRVIYMSGYTEDAIVQHGVLDDGTDFIPKPISLETLLARVRGALDRAR